MENPTFCFRFWQKYLSEQENTFLDITKKCQISAVYYEQYPFTIFSKGANVLNETELCRFFILAPWDFYYSIHRKQRINHWSFIKDSYWNRIKKYSIGGWKYVGKFAFWPNKDVVDWSPTDIRSFIEGILLMQGWLDIVNKNGVIPAIVLLGIRRRKGSSKDTLLHSQPTDVIRIIAKICAHGGWDFNMRSE